MKHDISNSIAQQYDINGLLQALGDELRPLTDKAQVKQLDNQDALMLAVELKRVSPVIGSLLSCLNRLTDEQLKDLLELEQGE